MTQTRCHQCHEISLSRVQRSIDRGAFGIGRDVQAAHEPQNNHIPPGLTLSFGENQSQVTKMKRNSWAGVLWRAGVPETGCWGLTV